MVEREIIRNFEETLESMLLAPHLTHKAILVTLETVVVLAVVILLMTIYK